MSAVTGRLERAKIDYQKMKTEAFAALQKNLPHQSMSNTDLLAIVRFKKQKGDAPQPSTKAPLIQRVVDTIARRDQTLDEFIVMQGIEAVDGTAPLQIVAEENCESEEEFI